MSAVAFPVGVNNRTQHAPSLNVYLYQYNGKGHHLRYSNAIWARGLIEVLPADQLTD